MEVSPRHPDDPRRALLALYDNTLHEVYGYLLARCGSTAVAEDLTSETFLAAVDAVRRDAVPHLTAAWLIGVARHKLVDHWRRHEREQRTRAAVDDNPLTPTVNDDWDVVLDVMVAREALATLRADHRCALTLRYLDGLAVRDVAGYLDRTVGATEVLLVRARAALRAAYEDHTNHMGRQN
jgi:RNA polymerase sigma-70 factor, ECF subfamily